MQALFVAIAACRDLDCRRLGDRQVSGGNGWNDNTDDRSRRWCFFRADAGADRSFSLLSSVCNPQHHKGAILTFVERGGVVVSTLGLGFVRLFAAARQVFLLRRGAEIRRAGVFDTFYTARGEWCRVSVPVRRYGLYPCPDSALE